MASRYQTLTWVSGSVTAGSSLNIDKTGLPNWFNIHQLIITPGIAATSMKVEIYKKSTFVVSDGVVFRTGNFTGPLVQPKEDTGSGPVQRNEGRAFPYEDLNSAGALHLKIYNNHSLDMTYTITLVYEPRLSLTTDASLALSGTDATDARTISQVADSTRQKVNVKVNSSSIGTQPIINFIAGTRMTVSGTDTGTEVQVTVTAANQFASMEATFWALKFL